MEYIGALAITIVLLRFATVLFVIPKLDKAIKRAESAVSDDTFLAAWHEDDGVKMDYSLQAELNRLLQWKWVCEAITCSSKG